VWYATVGGKGWSLGNVWYFYYYDIKTYCVLVKYLNTFSVILKIREFSTGDAKISSNSHDEGTGQWESWQMSAVCSAPKAAFQIVC
jgi:hypothetical protein